MSHGSHTTDERRLQLERLVATVQELALARTVDAIDRIVEAAAHALAPELVATLTSFASTAKERVQQTQQLEALVARRSVELEDAHEQLEMFSSSVAHDLRAPLRGVGGFSKALIEDYGDTIDPKAIDYLKRISDSAQRMAQLVDALLELARVTRWEMDVQPVNLSDLARVLKVERTLATPDRSVEMVIEEGLVVDGDAHLLQIALRQLVDNAWKFTGTVESPRVELASTLLDGERVFGLGDNGVGFDMKYVGRLFGTFQRLHSTDDFPGTGIGLAIVRRIVLRHGGRVWAEGRVNGGASIHFTLPEQGIGKTEQPHPPRRGQRR